MIVNRNKGANTCGFFITQEIGTTYLYIYYLYFRCTGVTNENVWSHLQPTLSRPDSNQDVKLFTISHQIQSWERITLCKYKMIEHITTEGYISKFC